ncbi:MAG: rhomboid family intramembrane serine protease [Eubacterium sp.]|nr:rhomboid family intramembrane serine protease [Eubacterium sp.]
MDFLKRKDIPFITVGLVVINVLVFLKLDVLGNSLDPGYLYEHGGMYLPDVLDNGEWYRVFTHMFLHSGFEHLANNMVMLAAVGYIIENEYGRWKYLISYFVCGLCATVLSAVNEYYHQDFAVGVGASGAIMGVFGIYIVMTVKARKSQGYDSRQLMVLLVLMVFGNMQEGVNWVAHLGGAVSGVILGALLYWPPKKESYGTTYAPYE